MQSTMQNGTLNFGGNGTPYRNEVVQEPITGLWKESVYGFKQYFAFDRRYMKRLSFLSKLA